mmetsp:Transcript_65548/g.189019  ORF Transcript_65548/g.189019 Transcript_65548/m.189019 type:complete len:229 (-) Transcript_65548:474-1160(-)
MCGRRCRGLRPSFSALPMPPKSPPSLLGSRLHLQEIPAMARCGNRSLSTLWSVKHRIPDRRRTHRFWCGSGRASSRPCRQRLSQSSTRTSPTSSASSGRSSLWAQLRELGRAAPAGRKYWRTLPCRSWRAHRWAPPSTARSGGTSRIGCGCLVPMAGWWRRRRRQKLATLRSPQIRFGARWFHATSAGQSRRSSPWEWIWLLHRQQGPKRSHHSRRQASGGIRLSKGS